MPELVIPDHFFEVVQGKPPQLAGAVADCVFRLGQNPRHPGLQTHLVRGTKNPKVFEAYVDKKNRVTFHRDGDKIVLRNNCNHDIVKNSP